MSSQWNASEEVYDLLHNLVRSHHGHLLHAIDEIAVIFREKASKAGGQVILGKSKKAPAILGLLSKVEYKFVLEIAGDEWLQLAESQKTALLDHLLCHCRCEEGEAGEMKYMLVNPEVSFFYDELDRNGDWRPRPAGVKQMSLFDLFKSEPQQQPSDEE